MRREQAIPVNVIGVACAEVEALDCGCIARDSKRDGCLLLLTESLTRTKLSTSITRGGTASTALGASAALFLGGRGMILSCCGDDAGAVEC